MDESQGRHVPCERLEITDVLWVRIEELAMRIFDNNFAALQKAMDLNFRRHTMLASNIANSETPNFRARDYNFAGELEQALGGDKSELKKTNSKHMDVGGEQRAHMMFDNSGAMGSDGNNVDLDLAAGKISEAARAYSNAASILSSKLRLLRLAATDRGGA